MEFIKPRLKPSHAVTMTDGGDVAIGELGKNSYIVRQPPKEFVDLLLLLDGTRTIPRLVRSLQRSHKVSEDDVRAVLGKLSDARLIDDGSLNSVTLSSGEVERYDRQQLQFSAYEDQGNPGFVYQERIKSQTVCVLGMGGWGTWMSLNLALAGFGTLRVVDGDHVELSNLNRQVLYHDESVGQPKVEAAKSSLNRINPHVSVETFQEFIEPDRAQVERVTSGADIICLCWANQSHFVSGTTEEVVHEVAFKNQIPVVEIAGDPFDIAVGPLYLNDGISPCVRCVRSKMQQMWWDTGETVSEFRKANVQSSPLRKVNAWQSAPSLSAIAGIAANEVISLASGYSPPGLVGRRLNISLRTYETRIDDFTKDPRCAWCA
jgi:molybdopterin/thiamine biosynthesis adenylyltransferase